MNPARTAKALFAVLVGLGLLSWAGLAFGQPFDGPFGGAAAGGGGGGGGGMVVGGTVSGGTPNRALFVGPGPVLADAMLDNTANAWVLVEGANTYAKVDTTNGAELVRIGSNGGPTVQIAGDPTAGEVGLQFSPSLPAVLAGGLFGVIDSTSTDTFIVNGAGDGSVEVKGTIFYIQSGTSVDVTTPTWNFASDTTFALGANNPFSFTGSAVRVANLAADPSSPANGWLYYNTTSNKFRCYQAGAWTNCISAGGSPSIGGAITSGTQYSVLFVDPAGTLAQDNASLNFNNATNMLTSANFTVNSGAGVDLVFTESTITRDSNIGAQTLTFNNPGTNRLDVLLQDGALGLANLAAAPSAPSNGFMYYDTTLSKFRCREGGVFVDCISTPSVGGAITGGTQHSVLFVDPAGTVAQDNTGLNFNASTDVLTVGGSGALAVVNVTSSAATDVVLQANNTNNASATAHAYLVSSTAVGGGDPFFYMAASGIINWGIGIDRSDGATGILKFDSSASQPTPGTNTAMQLAHTGAEVLRVSRNTDADNHVLVRNTDSGTGASAGYRLSNGTNSANFALYGTGVADNAYSGAGDAVISVGSGRLSLVTAGNFPIETWVNNTTQASEVSSTEFVINQSGSNYDLRVEGDTDVNLLFTDASTDRVGIRTNAPAATLDVAGSFQATGDAVLGDASTDNTTVFGTWHLNTNVTLPSADCDADAEVGRVRRYSKDANNITLCGCQKVGGVFLWAAVITGGDCT